MDIPFTVAEFFDVFRQYNTAVWPLQLVLPAAAVLTVFAIVAGWKHRRTWTLGFLSALWLWMGVVYHGMFFRSINPAASAFAALFVLQAVAFAIAIPAPGSTRVRADAAGITGAGLIIYGLVVYPLLGYLLGHRFPANPTFGLPCPTTLFTVGVLLWMRPLRWTLFIIPLAWSGIGTTAALRLGMYEDAALALAAVASVLVLFMDRVHRRESATTSTASVAAA